MINERKIKRWNTYEMAYERREKPAKRMEALAQSVSGRKKETLNEAKIK